MVRPITFSRSKPWLHGAGLAALAIAGVGLPTPAAAHDSAFHQGMAIQALRIMNWAGSCKTQSFDDCPPPAGVSAADWQAFRFQALAGRAKLVKMYAFTPEPAKQAEPSGAAQIAHAATVPDGNVDDTHLTKKIGNSVPASAALGALTIGAAAVVLPLYCACECVLSVLGFGGDDACDACGDALKHPLDFLDGKTLGNLLPGIGDDNDEVYTGLWHFINMTGEASNEYDDHQGMLYTQSGPYMPGSVDLLILVGTDIAGMTIEPTTSNGVKNYQMLSPGDAFPDGDSYNGSKKRAAKEWQAQAVGHTPLSPVDNLGLFGWQTWRDKGRKVTFLGYPLHALGDATVPMHVSGSTSWGHRPFEDAYNNLLTQGYIRPDFKRVLALAFQYRKEILAWRAQGHPGDIPIRRLVREVARHTLKYSLDMEGPTLAKDPFRPWPYNDIASAAYLVGADDSSTAIYEKRADAVSLYLPIYEDGIAAQLAFLMSAAEWEPGTPVDLSDLKVENGTVGDVLGIDAQARREAAGNVKGGGTPVPPPIGLQQDGPALPGAAAPARLVSVAWQPATTPATPAPVPATAAVQQPNPRLPTAPLGPVTRLPGRVVVPSRNRRLPAPLPNDAEQAFGTSLRVDYAALARLFVAGKLTPVQYVQRVRDREAKTRAARTTPGYYDAFVRGDRDGDFVPDDRDREPASAPRVATDARGVAVADATSAASRGAPPGPDARQMAALFQRSGFLVTPDCETTPPPTVPSLSALNTSLANRDLLFVLRNAQPANPKCPSYYEVTVRNAETSDAPKIIAASGVRTVGVIFGDTENEDKHAQPGRLVFRAHAPSGPAPSTGSRRKAWDIAANGFPRYGRIRVMNARGELSEWSDWKRFTAGSIAEP